MDEVIARISGCLLPHAPRPGDVGTVEDARVVKGKGGSAVEAAVLIALVRRPGGHTVLFTRRAASLRAHSGQIAFPGGKIDKTDAGAGAAALREACEEVALAPADATILGFMPNYLSATGYLITPVVAEITPSAPFVANPDEVAGLFEVPLVHLLATSSYHFEKLVLNGIDIATWRITYDRHSIWGITANMARLFRDRIAKGEGNDGSLA
jgi:8-oxo-dGTP pyrophosphatase MutT (NUDIX family)